MNTRPSAPACPRASDIADALAARIESLTAALFRERPERDGANTIRFPGRGGLIVTVRGAWRGHFSCWSADTHGDALDLIAYVRGSSLADARRWALDWLGDGAILAAVPERAAPPPPPAANENGDLARRIWSEGTPAADAPVVIRYLAGRGLTVPPDAPFRFHHHCPRGTERLPAMLALMSDPITNQPRGVHRTFLTADGSSKAEGQAKMMLGNAGVIRLVPDEDVTLGLGIGEGIESALTVLQYAEWRPVWATGSAGGIGRFPVLGGIECLTIFADHDDGGAGVAAARACADRWRQAGRECRIVLPPAGIDFNDIARAA